MSVLKISNFYVDIDGRTYRVALTETGRPLCVYRYGHDGHDVGRALDMGGPVGKAAIVKARNAQATLP